MHTTFKAGFWITSLTLFLSACGGQTSQTIPTEQAASAAKTNKELLTYLVATEASFAPYEFRDENGLVVGYDVDILNAIAEDQGFKVQFINQKWDGIFDTLKNGQRDIIAAALGVNEERQKSFELSDPYSYSGNIAVYIDPALKINTIDDLKNLKVSTQENTYTLEVLNKHGVTDILPAPTLYLALKEMMNQKAQVVAGDAAVLHYYLKSLPDTKYYSIPIKTANNTNNPIVFALKKGNTELLGKINTGLHNIKANGTYDKINQKWFGKASITD